MKTYYLYRHIRLDKNEPFYIGIGTKNKYYTRAKSKQTRSIFWKNITNKTNYNVEIIIESNSYDFIEQKEKEFIKLYGRRELGTGSLCNMTDGGDGLLGQIVSDESKIKMSKARKGLVKNISSEAQEIVKNMYISGKSVTSIERETVHRIETINRILDKYNLPRRDHRYKITKEIAEKTKEYINQGRKRKDICEELKISFPTYADIKRGKTWK